MGGPDNSGGVKRPHSGGDRGGGDGKRKKQYYTKGSKGTSGPIARSLPNGARGFLVTCDPRQENRAARESTVLLSEQIAARHPHLADRLEGPSGAAAAPAAVPAADDASGDATPAATVSDALAAEVKALREVKREKSVLQRVDLGVNGAVFHRVADDAEVAVSDVVERLLRAAKERGTTGARYSVRFVPVHATCYAKAEDAAEHAAKVCAAHFPKGKCSYGIIFRSRLNSGAKRDRFIKAVADAVEATDPGRFSVNLSAPDVVLCVEVVKTQCVIGAVGKYYHELAKLNVREVVRTPEEKEEDKKDSLERQARNIAAKNGVKEEDIKPVGEGAADVADEGAKADSTNEEVKESGIKLEEASEIKLEEASGIKLEEVSKEGTDENEEHAETEESAEKDDTTVTIPELGTTEAPEPMKADEADDSNASKVAET